MTQSTVKRAFVRGISADHIIQFLLNHAHSVTRNPDTNKMNSSNVDNPAKKQLETVPANIIKQIKVWEKTYKAYTFYEAKMITVASKASYQNIKKEADDKDAVLYCDGNSIIVVKSNAWSQTNDK